MSRLCNPGRFHTGSHAHCASRQLLNVPKKAHESHRFAFGVSSTWSSDSLTVSQHVGQSGLRCQRRLLLRIRPRCSPAQRLLWLKTTGGNETNKPYSEHSHLLMSSTLALMKTELIKSECLPTAARNGVAAELTVSTPIFSTAVAAQLAG